MKNIMNNEKSTNTKKYLNFEERKMIEKMIVFEENMMNFLTMKVTIGDEIKNNSTFHDGYKAELAHKKFLKNQLKKRNKDKIETNPVKLPKNWTRNILIKKENYECNLANFSGAILRVVGILKLL